MHNTSCSLSLTELLFYRDMPSGSGKEDGIEKRVRQQHTVDTFPLQKSSFEPLAQVS